MSFSFLARVVFVLQLALAVYGNPTRTTRLPSLYLCSDSTASNYDPQTTVIQGFGYYLHDYLSIPVHNLARAGRSTRSFQNQGLWAQLLAMVVPGDFVVIEMGHNDNGTPGTGGDVGKDRAVLPGLGEETIVVQNTTGGTGSETVYTFGHYLRGMIKDVRKRGGIPVLSGMVPTMAWTNGTLQTSWPFTEWARQTAESERTGFIDHTEYSVEMFQGLGETKSLTMFPEDHTHTNAAGATVNTESFVTGIKCGRSLQTGGLSMFINHKGRTIKWKC